MSRTRFQVLARATVLAAVFLAVDQAWASPAPGLGDAFTAIPKRVIGAVLGPQQPQQQQQQQQHDHDHHLHHHHHDAPASAPSAAPAAAPATAAPAAPTTEAPPTTAATTAAAASAATAAATDAAPRAAAPTTAQPVAKAVPGSSTTYTEEQIKACRTNWLTVTNSTVNDNLDILAILLDHGGFPGQLEKGVKWESNKTDADPNRWSYFYGDTDYKSYIRLEWGEVSSKTAPVSGTQPREVTGDIWWSPDDFCGKLRHAKYSQAPRVGAFPRPPVKLDVRAEVCSIKDSAAGALLRCSDALQDRAPLGPALIATLVG